VFSVTPVSATNRRGLWLAVELWFREARLQLEYSVPQCSAGDVARTASD